MPDREEILDAIKQYAQKHGRPPSMSQFEAQSGISERRVLKFFQNWSDAVRSAGFEPITKSVRIGDSALLEDWGLLVRKMRQIPTRDQYRREGRYSLSVFERHFGPWSTMPVRFRKFFAGNTDWADVMPLLPVNAPKKSARKSARIERFLDLASVSTTASSGIIHEKLPDRPIYGNYTDFRGLHHEPVNEGGVIFLFGMVAKELGYSVESMQAGFPDCEAKRQIGPGKWQRVRIEFEFESRAFREHGHPEDGCDVIVCWRHNWTDCPDNLEIVELSSLIQSLPKTDF